MSVTSAQRPTPVAGPLFRQTVSLRIEGAKRQKTLALLAAFIDAGQNSPTIDELAERLQFKPAAVRGLVNRLQADGYVDVKWKGKQPVEYELTLPGATQ